MSSPTDLSISARPRRSRRVGQAVLMVIIGTAVMWIASLVALSIYAGHSRDARRYDLVIEQGTAAQVAAGANPLALPSHWELVSGDVLVLDNRDSSVANLGPWSVQPGERREIVLRPFSGLVSCTLHPAGALTLDVQPVSTDWKLAGIATLAFGPLLGLGFYVVGRIADALSEPPSAKAPGAPWSAGPVQGGRPVRWLAKLGWRAPTAGVLAASALATTLVVVHPWRSAPQATLAGFVENPVRNVQALSLPEVTSGAPQRLVAQAGGLRLVLFGYTSCPDVCPTTLMALHRAVQHAGAAAGHVQVSMVTLDPTRDDAGRLRSYVRSFVANATAYRPDSAASLAAVTSAFGVAYEVGAASADGMYDITHSALVYGVDDTGRVVVEWPSAIGADAIARDLRLLLERSLRPADT